MTSERLLNILYLPRNFYISPKQISGYAPGPYTALQYCTAHEHPPRREKKRNPYSVTPGMHLSLWRRHVHTQSISTRCRPCVGSQAASPISGGSKILARGGGHVEWSSWSCDELGQGTGKNICLEVEIEHCGEFSWCCSSHSSGVDEWSAPRF